MNKRIVVFKGHVPAKTARLCVYFLSTGVPFWLSPIMTINDIFYFIYFLIYYLFKLYLTVFSSGCL
jgi:hypothetical protein